LHGEAKAKALIPLAVRNMQTKWRDAKTFAAVARCVREATAEFESRQRHIELQLAEQLQRQRETEEAERKRYAREQFEATWEQEGFERHLQEVGERHLPTLECRFLPPSPS